VSASKDLEGHRYWGLRCIGVGMGVALALAGAPASAAPPGMPDPSEMSGVPRPDPNLEVGTVTVRCLHGSFANPAVGTKVELELVGPKGELETRSQLSVEKGRATFSDLENLIGYQVTARATVGGRALESQTFVLGRYSGVALLLVGGSASGSAAGNSGAGAGTGQADPHGGQGAVPMPGKPFPLAGRPRGTLIVGVLDLSPKATGPEADPATPQGPIADIEVTLTIRDPAAEEGAEPTLLKMVTDADGRAMFEDLDETLPEGATIMVEAVIEDDGVPTRSESFPLGETAYAVILTRGTPTPAPGAQGGGQPRSTSTPTRMQLPGPRVDKQLSRGQVRVLLVDARDRPVAGQVVSVQSSQAAGGGEFRRGTTDAVGEVILDDLPVGDDSLAQVHVAYDGAPYRSTMFAMPEEAGAIVVMRVFEVTTDRTQVRSALQIDVVPRENDFAAVTFMYAVFVEGEKAFWPPDGMRLYGPPGTRSMHVLPESEGQIFNDGEAPWVDLTGPLEPGVELRLSFAVGLDHDGSLDLDWSAPFPLVEGSSIVTVPAELEVTKGVAGAPDLNPHAARDGGPLELYKLGHGRFQTGVCDRLAASGYSCPFDSWGGSSISLLVEELPVRSRVWPTTAWVLVGLTGVLVGMGFVLRPKISTRDALLQRRDTLMAELLALDTRGEVQAETTGPGEGEGRVRARLLRALDGIYRQLEALDPDPDPNPNPNPSEPPAAPEPPASGV